MSTGFNVSNGVRQGGILSPYLFCIYVDELSKMLNNVHVGCFKCWNNASYSFNVCR